MSRRLPPLNALRSFAAAAEACSFTKAGEALYVTQGAVSRQVKQLEEWLGKPVFLRTPQGIALTDAGRMLAGTIDDAFRRIEATADAIKHSSQRQMLKLNLSPTFATRWLAPRLAAFRKIYPAIDFSLTTDSARKARDLRNCDAAIVFADHDWDRCESSRLRLEEHVLVASPLLWTQGGLPPRIEECTLLHILDGDSRIPVWERWCEAHGITHLDTRAGLEFSTLDLVINAALTGTGVAIVDQVMVQPELRSGALRRLNGLSSEGPAGYWFVSLAQEPGKRACVQLFHDWIREQVDTVASCDAAADALSDATAPARQKL
ncbi:LysR substrate-binding domain-containing protein [Variovorax humicola]|uniref:LysR substrate-binding domain-containing protein n=1 Tax=Variovorax humicola TaxID=1769758 RepID=A0ABU8W300_9BURK